MDFVPWLHGQALGDPKREMPYARIYDIGPLIESVIGDGEFDIDALSVAIRDRFSDPWEQMEFCESLIQAEAVWRLDEVSREADEIDIPTSKAKYLCGYRALTGVRCTHKAVAGAARCVTHGGAIADPEVRRSLLLTAYARLLDGSETAVNTLIEVAVGSRNDLARVQAARELLDRAGLVQDQHVHLHVPDSVPGEISPLEELRKKLDGVRDRLTLMPSPMMDDEIVEAEIVEEDAPSA